MEKTPLIIILGLETTRTTQDTFDILDKFRSAYGSAIIEYYEVDIRNLSVMECKLDSANYPTGITCGFRLAQVVFDIGNINGLSYVVARFINDTINTIRHKEYERSNYNGSFFIGNHSINDIIDDYDYDPAEHVGIYSTYPIGGCWYRIDSVPGFDDYYSITKFTNVKNTLSWIGELDSPKQLYCDGSTTYLAIQLSECPIGCNATEKIKVMYTTPEDGNRMWVGYVVDMEDRFAIIHITNIAEGYYSYSDFVKDIIDAKVETYQLKDSIEPVYGHRIELITNKNNAPTPSKYERMKTLIEDYNDRYIKLTQMIDEQKATMNKLLELLKED